jgi:hypothetical protein
MSLDAQSAGSSAISSLLDPVSATNTAAATTPAGAWVDTQGLTGYLIATQQVGAVTAGSITGQLMAGTDANGTAAVAVPGGAFAAVAASSNAQRLVIPKTVLPARYVGYVGTVAGTSAVAAVSLLASKQYQ